MASILIVDDEPNNFDVIETLLSDRNDDLHYASNGKSAIASLDLFAPDLILLDVMMPDLNGVEVCQQIKAMPKWKATPIVMVTALNSKEDLAHCLEAGADDFISKPINRLELCARVQSMLRIKSQYDDLQTLLQSREDLVNMMVHDLRNPLMGILFGLSVVERGKLPPKLKDKVSRSILAAQRLQGLIDDLILMGKMEQSQIKLNRTEVDLSRAIDSATERFLAIAEQKNIQLIHRLPEPGHFINVDEALFQRMLDNLLSNAIKFSPSNSEIILSADLTAAGEATIQVADMGPGVPEELKESIFQKYETGMPIANVSQIGLGLAFCKMVSEAHGGKISVRSNQPRGTIFEIVVPPKFL
ncbi:MAG: hybrid sensor histidine kinase/response regulator [Limnospira sp.]